MRITVFDNQFEAVEMLPLEDREGFWTSVMAYAFRGTDPGFEGVQAAIFAMMKPALDKSIEGQINGAKGGNGRGNLGGIKPPPKTPLKNPLEKPPLKTHTENQIERKSKGIEEEGFSFPEEKKNHSYNGASAGAGNPALRTESPWANKAIADTMKLREEHAELEAGATPCPFDLKAIFDEVDRMDEVV